MQRTISAMVGKGSVNHNSRKFKAANVDGERSHLNIDYCNEPIKKIYHDLFDEALKRYNDKQTRADRKIANYYEKIRNSKQEKPFHELILQIGGQENMSAESENGTLARQVLDEYYRGFQERNPQLKVFSAHLHMDEATPHIHIDFVPFTTGSKRGLSTRVSLKQALAAQGFKGGSRGDTEWNQWVSAEKSALAFVMERYGVEWEHKGTHEKHLSVLDYKKQEREKEVTKLGDEISKQEDKLELANAQIDNLLDCEKSLQNVKENFDEDPQYQLPEPPALMSAKAYKTKIAQPIINALKELVQGVIVKYFEMKSTLAQWRQASRSLYDENIRLSERVKSLEVVNSSQKAELQDYKLLRKVFGYKQVDEMLNQAKEITQSKKRNTRFKNCKDERQEHTMENRIYNEKNVLWYEKQGNYYLPCLELPEQEDVEIGVWGERHRQYLLAHHKVKYYNMLSSCTLCSHLANVEKRATKMFDNIVKELAEKENVSENLKANDMMLWV